MKRSRKHSKKLRKNSRKRKQENRVLSYDPLERRQLLAFDTGIDLVGAALADGDINSLVPNPEGDVGPNHFVEIGEQTFTVYDRAGTVVEATSLNQFFLDAGADLFGEDLQSPRVIYDRLAERWFAVAVGDGNGVFAGNRIHIAFSDSSDPSGQWQQLDFVADITGVRVHDNPTLAVDADGIYFATQNFDNGVLEDVSIYSIPKADILDNNPTLANISQFDNLSVFDYGVSIQFASNFDASDGTVFGFSTQSQDVSGTGNASQAELNPSVLNTFEIQGADGRDAVLTASTQVAIDAAGTYVAPKPVNQILADQNSTIEIEIDGGLTQSLVEQDGSVYAAQSVGIIFVEGVFDIRVNSISWFEVQVAAGQAPIIGAQGQFDPPTTNVGNFLPDPPQFDMFPDVETNEFTGVTYFNPTIAVSESGLAALTWNSVSSFDLLGTGAAVPGDPAHSVQGINTLLAVALTVSGSDGPAFQFEPVSPFDARSVLQQSNAPEAFTPAGGSEWGAYASLRTDPTNPNAFFSVSPFQDEVNDEWAVSVTEIFPLDFTPVVPGSDDGNTIIIRISPEDPNIIEVEIDGVVTDRFSQSLIRSLVVSGAAGADIFIVDYTFGNPIPFPTFESNGTGGLTVIGGAGTDSVESRTVENVDFLLDQDIGGGNDTQNGTFTPVTENGEDLPVEDQDPVVFIDFETVIGGSGSDTFVFEDGLLEGNAEGGDGDDRFIFIGDTRVDGSVNGGAGFNTLDLLQRDASTEIVLFSPGQNQGFNGRTVDGPIGQFSDVLDQFRDISLVLGAPIVGDSIFALNQFEATYTVTIPTFDSTLRNPADSPSFVASSLQQGGQMMYFTNFETLAGSVINDTFNILSNDDGELPNLTLQGRTGDDEFNFSSDAPVNEGVLADIAGLIRVNGGTGANSIVFSDFGRLGPDDILLLSARISGPVEVIYFTEGTGTMDVTIHGSDGTERDRFFLQSFLSTNTLNVFGNGGDDEFIIQDLSQAEVRLFGGEGDDEYIIEQVSGIDDRNVMITDSINAEMDVALIAGTLLDEVFVVDFDSFESDQFTFIGVEEFGFDGRGGDDEFYVRAISVDFPIQLRGGDGNDVFYVSSDAPSNFGDLAALNNNLSIEAGTGINRILISNESGSALDAEIFADQITGLFNGVLSYAATGGVFGLVGPDGNVDPNNFGGVDITGSNSGDDRFQITSFAAQHSLVIDGRLGEDEFIIGNAGSAGAIEGVVIVDGGSEGDTYQVFLENLSTETVMIDDTGFDGDDTLQANGSEGDDNISLTQTGVTSGAAVLGIDEFFESVAIDGLGGNDLITMTNSPADSVVLAGNEGNDQIIVNGTVGANELTIFGDAGQDQIDINESSLQTVVMAFGGDEVDSFLVGTNVRGDVTLDGEAGQDVYAIELTDNSTRNIQIVDMEGANDVIVIGTATADVFQIDNAGVTAGDETIGLTNLASLGVEGRGGDDIFNISETMIALILDGGSGNDVFNVASNAPDMTGDTSGILADIQIDGGTGNNQLRVTNVDGPGAEVMVASSVLTGLTNDFSITYGSTGGQFARPDGLIGGIYIVSSDSGNDTFEIGSLNDGDTLRIESRGGADIFNISNAIAGDVLLDGGEEADVYNYEFGGLGQREINIVDTGTTGTDRLNLVGSEFDDQITISTTGISDAVSTLNFNVPVDLISIAGLGGADTFIINGAPASNVSLQGNQGNDTFIINSTAGIDNIDLFAGLGNDMFEFNGSSEPTRIDALGSSGADTYNVGAGAFGKLFLDGEEGGDTYQVIFAGQGERRINTRDTGSAGFDQTLVQGSGLDDRIALRTTRFLMDNEVVVFDQNTERVQAEGLAGNDRFVIFGTRSPLAEIFAGAGEDNFVMNSGSSATQIDLHGENGDDNFLIRKTTVDTETNLFGENGDDRFNIGSTANQDSGSLGLIRGELNVFGGGNSVGGEDVLYANDRGVNAAYSYSVTPSAITPIAGPANLPRTNFAGINYNSSMEAVRIDGTDQVNLFRVFASQTTRFFIDGNNPSTNNADRIELMFTQNDGSKSFFTNPGNGEGFISFTNGNEVVQFEEIEDVKLINGGGGASGFVLPENFDDFISTSNLDDFDF